MSCLIVSAALGIVTTVCRKSFPQNWHIGWLNVMIFGSTIALGAEHLANGEFVPFPPFLTAMASPQSAATMLGEMLAVGVPMTMALVAAWAVVVVFYERAMAAKAVGA